jgi:hypothetical protein
MHWLDKVAKLLHVASGKKLVTMAGLTVATAAAVCDQLGEAWLADHIPFLVGTCTFIGLVGTVTTAFGKGLADRRKDSDRLQMLKELGRLPNGDGD